MMMGGWAISGRVRPRARRVKTGEREVIAPKERNTRLSAAIFDDGCMWTGRGGRGGGGAGDVRSLHARLHEFD